MRKLIVLLALSALCLQAKAQGPGKATISLGPEVAIPFHNTNGYSESLASYKSGGGFSAMLELPVLSGLKFTLNAGYLLNAAKPKFYVFPYGPVCSSCSVSVNSGTPQPAYKFVPVMAGFRYYIRYVFIGGQMGAAIKASSATQTAYLYGGDLGGYVPFAKRSAIELSAGLQRGFKSSVYDYPYPLTEMLIRLAYKYQF